VDLFEKRKDPIGKDQALEWRSLNIFINGKVEKSWKKLGVLEDIRNGSKKVQYLTYHLDKGDTVKYLTSAPEEYVYIIRREHIQTVLATKI
jgi:hypothetical protein